MSEISPEAGTRYNAALRSWLPSGVVEASQQGDPRALALLVAYRQHRKHRSGAHWDRFVSARAEYLKFCRAESEK